MKFGLIAWLVAGWFLVTATGEAATFPPLPSIAVSATDGMFTKHATAVGAGLFIDALLTVEQPNPVVRVDVYIGVISPDGRFASFVGDPQAPSLAAGSALVPLLVNVVPGQTQGFRVARTFAASEPQGWYVIYGLVVPTGADPLNPNTWINTSFFPLSVQPATGPVFGGS